MHTTLIDTAQLAELLPRAGAAVLDCRFDVARPDAGRAAWRREHIPGARHVDLDRDMASAPDDRSGRHPLPDIDAFQSLLGRLGVTAGGQVVVYDDAGGAIAARMWWLLRWAGHEAAALLDGGFPKWRAEGRPVTAAAVPDAAARCPVSVREDGWMSTGEVAEALAAGRLQLLDARAPERYRGETEPLDARAGHIPGSVNVPFRGNLNEDGTFRSPDELRRRFAPFAADGRPVCHSCGSGVTACHNLLAMAHAGLEPGRLYVGSWSEWSRDPARPAATGAD